MPPGRRAWTSCVRMRSRPARMRPSRCLARSPAGEQGAPPPRCVTRSERGRWSRAFLFKADVIGRRRLPDHVARAPAASATLVDFPRSRAQKSCRCRSPRVAGATPKFTHVGPPPPSTAASVRHLVRLLAARPDTLNKSASVESFGRADRRSLRTAASDTRRRPAVARTAPSAPPYPPLRPAATRSRRRRGQPTRRQGRVPSASRTFRIPSRHAGLTSRASLLPPHLWGWPPFLLPPPCGGGWVGGKAHGC